MSEVLMHSLPYNLGTAQASYQGFDQQSELVTETINDPATGKPAATVQYDQQKQTATITNLITGEKGVVDLNSGKVIGGNLKPNDDNGVNLLEPSFTIKTSGTGHIDVQTVSFAADIASHSDDTTGPYVETTYYSGQGLDGEIAHPELSINQNNGASLYIVPTTSGKTPGIRYENTGNSTHTGLYQDQDLSQPLPNAVQGTINSVGNAISNAASSFMNFLR